MAKTDKNYVEMNIDRDTFHFYKDKAEREMLIANPLTMADVIHITRSNCIKLDRHDNETDKPISPQTLSRQTGLGHSTLVAIEKGRPSRLDIAKPIIDEFKYSDKVAKKIRAAEETMHEALKPKKAEKETTRGRKGMQIGTTPYTRKFDPDKAAAAQPEESDFWTKVSREVGKPKTWNDNWPGRW